MCWRGAPKCAPCGPSWRCRPTASCYGDLGAGGYIDHFFVAGGAARRGVGSALLRHIAACAQQRGITALTADVSLCAQAFFAQHGFELIERRTVVLRGVALANARMRRAAVAAPYSTSSL